jgi:hypothetical protein
MWNSGPGGLHAEISAYSGRPRDSHRYFVHDMDIAFPVIAGAGPRRSRSFPGGGPTRGALAVSRTDAQPVFLHGRQIVDPDVKKPHVDPSDYTAGSAFPRSAID